MGRKNIKKYFILFSLLPLFFPVAGESQPASAKICYFSLNNTKEVTRSAELVNWLNKKTGSSIRVKEYLTHGENPEDAFMNMVEGMVEGPGGEEDFCDSLVISGHHAGLWGGKNAEGELHLPFLERMSCDPRYSDWFRHVKALWLQGCRTLGSEKIVPGAEEHHTGRVSRNLLEDSFEIGISELSLGFSTILDEDNPLSSRYLRIFEDATIFGWRGPSPKENQGSELSMLFHIAEMIKMNNRNKKSNNIRSRIEKPKTLTEKEAVNCVDLLNSLMGYSPDPICIDRAISAWRTHWWNSPYSEALSPLLKTPDSGETQRQLEIKANNCILKLSDNTDEILSTMDRILSDEEHIGYSFNSIMELAARANRLEKSSEENKIQGMWVESKLHNSNTLKKYLKKKLLSKKTGLISKIEYFKFARKYGLDIFENDNLDYAARAIRKRSLRELLKIDPKVPVFERINFKATLLESLGLHGIAGDLSFIETLINNPKSENCILNKIAKHLHRSEEAKGFNSEKVFDILKKIMRHPNANFNTFLQIEAALIDLNRTGKSIESARHGVRLHHRQILEILEYLLDRVPDDPYFLKHTAGTIFTLKIFKKEALPILRKILEHRFDKKSLKDENFGEEVAGARNMAEYLITKIEDY